MGVGSFLHDALFGSAEAAAGAASPVAPIANLVTTIIDHTSTDKTVAQAQKDKVAEMALSGELAAAQGQLGIDLAEAQSQSVFVAGWRPFLGWIGGLGVGYEFVLRPILNTILQHWHVTAPALELQDLLGLLGTLLGMGALRSYDKSQGTGNGH